MNIQHSSRTDAWFTPFNIVERARSVLGGIDLDPASCQEANQIVRAQRFFTREQDGLGRDWHGRVFLNPPGGKTGNRSNTALWWRKLINEHWLDRVPAAIFLAFSLEAAQTTQDKRPSVLDFPFCVPKRRIRFIDGAGRPGKLQPSHSNVIVGVGVSKTLFREHFESLGMVRL